MATTTPGRLPGRRDALIIAAAAVAVNLIGAVGVPFTAAGSAWFAALELPGFYPPSWAFGVVWPVLYALCGAAAALVFLAGRDGAASVRRVRTALALFGVQLAVNVAWSPVFWGLERLALGLVVLVVLVPLIVATIALFARVDRRAAALLVPYLAWVCFATALNYAVWALN